MEVASLTATTTKRCPQRKAWEVVTGPHHDSPEALDSVRVKHRIGADDGKVLPHRVCDQQPIERVYVMDCRTLGNL